MSTLKKIAIALFAFAALIAVAASYYLGSEDVPETTDYEIGLGELRALAKSRPGALPKEIRFENIADGGLPRAILMAGEPFEFVTMPRPVFQVLYPDSSFMLIDAAYDRATHEQLASPETYDDAAWERLIQIMEGAAQIVITHEHDDHMAGLANHPRPDAIASKVILNPEQMDPPRGIDTQLPETLTTQIEPLDYADAVAIAPGVVLKRAPGHTPGSQMVFVSLADGRELLFLGDVVWNLDAITQLKYRPRLITDLVINEDRAAVLDQIRALHDLHKMGGVQLVVSHDRRTFGGDAIAEGFRR